MKCIDSSAKSKGGNSSSWPGTLILQCPMTKMACVTGPGHCELKSCPYLEQ